MKFAIEDSFPIVEINRLAVPERNAFKPIYQMHKWFARRASCVFRAILLGALKPLPLDEQGRPLKSGAEVIMEEFYKDHTHDPDTNGKVILDPFMGGGTTVVEALRLGCRVIGIDLNPVAWFIVKTETEPVDLDELRAAFDRLAHRVVPWSGKPLRQTLLDLYKTTCPSCGGEADIIYTFWVKSAPCTAHNCTRHTPLFSDYLLSRKTPSIRYFEDCDCPACGKVFDWEIEPACMIGDPARRVNATQYSAGPGRANARWSYGFARQIKGQGWRGSVECPWCNKEVTPGAGGKTKRKKVELSVLLCPKCEAVWQYRGPLPEQVACPACRHEYDPTQGNVPAKGKFLCGCGNQSKIIEAIRTLPEDQLLPLRPYGMECWCPRCAQKPDDDGQAGAENLELFSMQNAECRMQNEKNQPARRAGINHSSFSILNSSLLWKNRGKFFKRIEPKDLELYRRACELWDQHRVRLLYPKSKIPVGAETKRLHEHHYRYWHQMFNPRQLLALSSLLEGIGEEKDEQARELLLCAFSNTLEANNLFTRQIASRTTPGGTPPAGIFARHDFQPKATICEQNVWGTESGNNTFIRRMACLEDGVTYGKRPWDNQIGDDGKNNKVESREALAGKPDWATLIPGDSRSVLAKCELADCVITDPPYSDNVNYAELADFFYVWLRLVLADNHPEFSPEVGPKSAEIIENRTRGASADDFENGLTEVFAAARSRLKQGGLLAFTFHHSEGSAWESLLNAVLNAGLELGSVFPIHGEREQSLHLLNKEGAIAYDLVHVCRKRAANGEGQTRSWAGVRQEIRKRARREIAAIEAGRYGNEPLPAPDRNIILIGKCLELYSRHYGRIVDHAGQPVPLHAALEEIRMLVDQLTSEGTGLPGELENIDAPSYVYLTCLCDRREIKSDEVHKATRTICEPATLLERDLMIRGRAKRGRTYEVKSPLERLDRLKEKFGAVAGRPQGELFGEELAPVDTTPGVIFIDYVHFLLGLVETGESVRDWLETFRGRRTEIRAALEYLARRNRAFADPVKKIVGLLDEKTLFNQ